MTKCYELNFIRQTHSQSMLQNLRKWKDTGFLCDLTLVVSGKKINCHKIILATDSPFFKAMFEMAMKEKDQNVIGLSDINYETLEAIVNYFYTSEILLTEDNIYDLIRAVDLYQIASLRPACAQFMTNAVNSSCSLSLHCIASRYRYLDVADETIDFILKNFSSVCKEDDFKEAPYEMVSNIFKSPNLGYSDEDLFLNAILDWIEYDRESRIKHVFELLENVIPQHVTDWDAVEARLKPLFGTTDNAESINRLNSWIDVGRNRALAMKHSTKARFNVTVRDKRFHEICMAIGGVGDTTTDPFSTVEVFWPFRGWVAFLPMWVGPTVPSQDKVVPKMKVPRYHHAVATCNHLLYVLGGNNGCGPINSVECYNGRINEWHDMPNLPCSLDGAAATCFDHKIYVSGGFSDQLGIHNRLWMLNIDESPCGKVCTWTEGPRMLHKRAYHGLVNVYGVLYAVGGADENGQTLNSVECLLLGQDVWMEISPLTTPRSHFACVAFETSIIVLCGKFEDTLPTIECYDTLENYGWRLMSRMTSSRSSCAAAVFDNRVMLAGGGNVFNSMEIAYKLNPYTGNLHQVSSMKFHRFGLAMATIKLY